MQGRKRRLVRARRGTRRALIAVASLAALCATLGGAATAQAGIPQELAAFYDCPLSNPTVTACIVSKTTSGQFTLGSKTVSVAPHVITLQGGIAGGENEEGSELVAAADGNTLSHTPLTIPGGLVGIELDGITEVTATAELAGPVILDLPNLGSNNPALTMPLQVKLDNPLLLNSCLIGSPSEPVTLNLITGTTNPPSPNSPITGSKGTVHVYDHNKIIEVAGSSLVDNSFAAPGVNGCGGPLALAVDPVVDLDAGLPAAAGHNTAILNGSFVTTTPRVIESEAVLPQIGRCKKVAAVKENGKRVFHGRYESASCVFENPFPLGSTLGKYEWTPGPGPNNKFSGSSGKMTLETVGHHTITCVASTNAGEYTGEKTATATLTLTGCKRSTGETCQSSGAAAGEIVTSPLSGELGFIEDFYEGESTLKVSVGLDLKHSPTLLTAQCGAEAVAVSGSVIVPVTTVDKMAKSFNAKFLAPGGRQAPESFEEGPTDVLTSNIGGPSEQTGLTGTEKLVNQEPIEIKAATE
jgi:hypothetical protein